MIRVVKKLKHYRTFLLLLVLGLAGCDNSNDDVQKFIDEVKKQPPPPIEALPTIKPIQVHTYSSNGLRSPFEAPNMKSAVAEYQPDLNRQKQPLESYSLDSLKMVGTFFKADGDNPGTWALILTKDGKVVPITKGNYIGKNFGKITKIENNKIMVEETVLTADGWIKRNASLVLPETDSQN